MALETGTYISDLTVTNPTATDPRSEGDDHIRLLKTTIKNTFPNVNGAVTPTDEELNFVDGVTSAIQGQLDAKASLAGAETFVTGLKKFTNSLLALLGSSTGYTIFTSANAGASNYTITVPAVTDTLAILGANTFTAAQNFARATVASHATTADIWGAAGNQIDWTGTETTTAFPNAPQAGAERVLICAGACSFTAGANMLIDGVASGATVTCAANDKVRVYARSTTVFELTRTKYDGTAQVNPVATATVSGLVPTPPNNTTTFLRGDATFAAPPASAMVLLSTVTATAAATVDIETTFNSTYDEYLIVGTNVKPSVDANLWCRLKLAGAYVASGYHHHTAIVTSAGTGYSAVVAPNSATVAQIVMSGTINGGEPFAFTLSVNNPAGSELKFVRWEGLSRSTNDSRSGIGHGMSGNGVMTGIRFLLSTGTITGTFRLYGISNS